MTDYNSILLYILVSLCIALVGIMSHREELKKTYTDAGCTIFLVALFWLPLLMLVGCLIPIAATEWLFMKALKINIWK